MANDADFWIDRLRLKRRLTAWRIVGVVAIAAAILLAVGPEFDIGKRPHVARLVVDGIILDERRRTEVLHEVADDARVKALIVRIDSPGGTVVGGESLYRYLRRVSEKKPVVAVMRELATSAAYMTALGSDHLIAEDGTITGSVGVILQTANVTGLLEMIGVKPETFKSGPLKAQPNPLESLSPEARKAIEAVVLDSFEMFVALVRERRHLSDAQVRELADGRVFTGRQAMAAGLIDSLGGESEARAWLSAAHGIDPALQVRDLVVSRPEDRLRDIVSGVLGKAFFSETLRLDGLVSLWHPGG